MAQVVTVYFATNRMPPTDAGGTIIDFGRDLDPALSPERSLARLQSEIPQGLRSSAEHAPQVVEIDVPNDRARSSRSR